MQERGRACSAGALAPCLNEALCRKGLPAQVGTNMIEALVIFRDLLISIAVSLLGGVYHPDRVTSGQAAQQERGAKPERCDASDCEPVDQTGLPR